MKIGTILSNEYRNARIEEIIGEKVLLRNKKKGTIIDVKYNKEENDIYISVYIEDDERVRKYKYTKMEEEDEYDIVKIISKYGDIKYIEEKNVYV